MKSNNKQISWTVYFLKSGVLFILICITSTVAGKYTIPPPLPRDDRHIEKPQFKQYNMFANGVNRLSAETHVRFFDISRHIRSTTGNQIPAMNVDAFGEVPDCSWFTNRNGREAMSLEAIARGPHTGSGPDTSGEWQVIKAKTDGMSPGFWIKDSRGDRYIIKFDPLGYPELTTGAEVISSKILYAAGYNVPENYVTVFNPEKVTLAEKVKFTDSRGRKRAMKQSDLDEIFRRIDRQSNGMIRAHASKFIPGTPVGSFRFAGTRGDDPNDFIPHEHRRELRGLLVISSWIQHYDNNLSNTFDSYVIENGRGYVKHYLIDFGGTFGASMHGPQPGNYGNEKVLDLPLIFTRILSFGFYRKQWERWDTIPFKSVGTWESKTFDPRKYQFNTPVESMQNMTEEDAFWGAKIVMSFTDEQIDTLVSEGHYSDTKAQAYVAEILKERRDKIGRAYFSRLCPLDNFYLEIQSESNIRLHFEDLAVKGNLTESGEAEYNYGISKNGSKLNWKNAEIIKEMYVPLSDEDFENLNDGFLTIAIQSRHGEGKWSKVMYVYLHTSDSVNQPVIAGLER